MYRIQTPTLSLTHSQPEGRGGQHREAGGHALLGPRHLPRSDHEPPRVPLAHDGGEDDRAHRVQGEWGIGMMSGCYLYDQ